MNWSYISGFFDADGSITLAKVKGNNQKTIQLSFHNTKLEILEAIQAFIYLKLGIKGFIAKKRAKKDNHADSYDLKYVYLTKCLSILKHINTLHPLKLHRKTVAFKFAIVTPRNGKYTDEILAKRDKLVQEFFKEG
ncbi:MAG: LAGLIDADG family homing endonuclease [Bacteroidota bacterium]